MTDRPIIFSASMVRAMLDGRKTQTRRILRLPKWASTDPNDIEFGSSGEPEVICQATGCLAALPMPYAAGDRLYVRETWSHDGPDLETVQSRYEDALSGGVGYGPYYRATETAPGTLTWRSSIHMPRWASRLTLVVTEVRVERLQDISEADAKAEGVESIHDHGVGNRNLHRIAFEQLWERLHCPGSWLANPWVAAISFTVHRANIGDLDIGAAA